MDLSPLTLKSSTPLPGQPHGSTCFFRHPEGGRYERLLEITISPEPAFLGNTQLKAGALSVRQAKRSGGRGAIYNRKYLPKNTAGWETMQTSVGDAPCSEEETHRIQAEQIVPACNPEPTVFSAFVIAYGSPKPNVEPVVFEANLTGEEAAATPLLKLLYLTDQFYAGKL